MIRFAVVLAVAVAALVPVARAAEPFEMMSAAQVEKVLGQPGVYVFDANSQERYEQGHVPGAKRVSKKTLAENLPEDRNATLIFYCTNPR